jgi:hypothetical protein
MMRESMTWIIGLAGCLSGVVTLVGEEPPDGGKATVELRWVETQPIEGLTEAEGFQSSCDPATSSIPTVNQPWC